MRQTFSLDDNIQACCFIEFKLLEKRYLEGDTVSAELRNCELSKKKTQLLKTVN